MQRTTTTEFCDRFLSASTLAARMKPKVHPSCFIAPTATIVGNVEIDEGCSVWHSAVIRGDVNPIKIGAGSNVQDCCVIHASPQHATTLGKNVSLGHGAIVHGAVIQDNVIVGINAVVMNGAEIGRGSIIGVNAVVRENTKVPPRSLVVGVPGKVVRENDERLEKMAVENALLYQRLRDEHKKGMHESWMD